MSCPGTVEQEPLARCRECGSVQTITAIAQCSECSSRYLERVDATQETLRDALADIDNAIANHTELGYRLAKVQAALWKLVKS